MGGVRKYNKSFKRERKKSPRRCVLIQRHCLFSDTIGHLSSSSRAMLLQNTANRAASDMEAYFFMVPDPANQGVFR